MKLEDIDIYNPDSYIAAAPHDQFALLREQAPVFWHSHPDGDGFWLLTKHEDILQVSRDHKTFSAEVGAVMIDNLPPHILELQKDQLLSMDPPRHSPIRRTVIRRFTGKILAETEDIIRKRAQLIIRNVINKPECDFVYDVAAQLPTAIICAMMEIPEDMWDQVLHWSDALSGADDPDMSAGPEATLQAAIDMGTYGYKLAYERLNGDGEDLISLLINVEIEGHKFTPEQFGPLFTQIVTAGNETTRTLISSGMLELINNPELYQALEKDYSLIPNAVEEMLRWVCPLHYFRRTTTCDAEIRGQTIKKGQRVMMSYAAGNRDPEVFDNPERFDIYRDDNPHLAFGYGIHLCLGANLARMETRIFFEEFFNAFKGVELAGEPVRLRSNLTNALKKMPVRLLPR